MIYLYDEKNVTFGTEKELMISKCIVFIAKLEHCIFGVKY